MSAWGLNSTSNCHLEAFIKGATVVGLVAYGTRDGRLVLLLLNRTQARHFTYLDKARVVSTAIMLDHTLYYVVLGDTDPEILAVDSGTDVPTMRTSRPPSKALPVSGSPAQAKT